MESPIIDVDFLAKETFALSEALKGSHQFDQVDFFNEFEQEEVLESPILEESIVTPKNEDIVDSAPFPTGTGLVFCLDQSVSTFCVRGVQTHNINQTIHDLMCEDENLLKRLKIRDKQDLSNVHYFETKSIEQAEIISEYIINRRFPIHEEMVCNLSDPGFSWWYESNDNGFNVFFKAQSVNRDTDYVRLGPIGDRRIAAKKLAMCESLLKKYFSIAEYSSTEKSFEIRAVNPTDKNYLMFKNIFENGSYHFDFDKTSLCLEHQRLALFLEEIAVVRGFWISIEQLLI
ncbi:hypothetical protein [Halobacteriovorax sp. HLS]|uniref:hypothetical protein n=1 Tax=Halobacteriovorax sp. HLS TaxID=2234000 RepID=UPI000FD71130|nr:hypothetical protein [Halobacteriovorax sp. HLS]